VKVMAPKGRRTFPKRRRHDRGGGTRGEKSGNRGKKQPKKRSRPRSTAARGAKKKKQNRLRTKPPKHQERSSPRKCDGPKTRGPTRDGQGGGERPVKRNAKGSRGGGTGGPLFKRGERGKKKRKRDVVKNEVATLTKIELAGEKKKEKEKKGMNRKQRGEWTRWTGLNSPIGKRWCVCNDRGGKDYVGVWKRKRCAGHKLDRGLEPEARRMVSC